MTRVVEINSLERLAPYHLAWASLLRETRRGTFHQSLAWLEAYWSHFGAGQRLRVLLVEEEGGLMGILPLVVRPERTRLGTLRVLTYPLHDWGSFYGPIGRQAAATLSLGMKHIARTPRDWDLLDLRWIATTVDSQRTPVAMALAGLPSRRGVWKRTGVIDTSIGFNAWWKSRTSKLRGNIRRAEKRTRALGAVEFLRYRPRGFPHGDGDPRWDLYDQCVELAERSWQGASVDGTTLSHPTVRGFFRETHERAAAQGAVDLCLLKLDGRPAAFAYNYRAEGYLLGLRMGYEPTLAEAGLGTYLKTCMFRDSFERRDGLFDIGPDDLERKLPWVTHVVPSLRHTHYPSLHLRSQLLRMGHWLGREENLRPAREGAIL